LENSNYLISGKCSLHC